MAPPTFHRKLPARGRSCSCRLLNACVLAEACAQLSIAARLTYRARRVSCDCRLSRRLPCGQERQPRPPNPAERQPPEEPQRQTIPEATPKRTPECTTSERVPPSLHQLLMAGPPKSVMNSRRPHSITSSARSRIDGSMARPSAVAVARFTIISNFVGSCTGRSPGFSPRRMRST